MRTWSSLALSAAIAACAGGSPPKHTVVAPPPAPAPVSTPKRLEVVTVEPPHPIMIEGSVVDPDGAPAAGAEVALITAASIVAHVEADATGRFRFATTSGPLGLSAHRAGAVGAFIDQRPYTADARDVRIALGKDGGVTVAGRTVPKPAAALYLQLSMRSDHDADLFAVPVAADGTFSAVLPRGDAYTVELLDGELAYQKAFPRTGERVDVSFPIINLAPGPPPTEVVDHIARHAIPLTTPEAGHGLADMEPIGKLIGDARVVALGEATHGSREFFQIKHRFLEYLVARQGFTVFAIEANQPECRAINDYVVNGKGNARDALDGIYFWTWNTEEVLAMIEWMRAWNADPKHPAKIQFTGFDMQTSTIAYKNVEAFLRERVPERAGALVAPIVALGDSGVSVKTTAAQRATMAEQLVAIGKLFDANRAPWTAATGATRFADLRHDVTVLEQALRMYSAAPGTDDGFAIRDRSMADNVAWLLDQSSRARLVVWAHNWHVSNTLDQFPNMGGHLRARFGKRYLNFGFVFGEGSFQAIDFTAASRGGLREFTLGPPPESDTTVAFSRTGKPLLVLDLRALPARGPVHDWFTSAHAVRETGAGFSREKDMTRPFVPAALYDALIFVDRTSRARPAHK